MDIERIAVGGMSCGHCVDRVRAAVEKVAGVELDGVEIGEVRVGFGSDRTARADVIAAIRTAGYTAE